MTPEGEVALGVTLPQFTTDGGAFVSAARRAEALGLDSIWVFDHMWPLTGGKSRPAIECWTALSYIAAATERIRLGTLVTRSSLRHPALLAKMASTVASIAPGRVILGIGSGDEESRDENEAFGIEYFGGQARIEQFLSTVSVVTGLLGGDEVTHSDPYVRLDSLASTPRPTIPPPVWVAGRSQAVLETAGRLADGWNAWGSDPQRFASDAAIVRRAAGDRRVELTWGGLVVIGATDAAARAKLGHRTADGYLVGGPDAVAEGLLGLIEAGASHVIATFPDAARPEPYELFATRVRAALRPRAGYP